MKKLFLTSSFQKVADKLPGAFKIDPKAMTVAFVPTAADPYEDKWFMDVDRQKLVVLGFKIIDLPLKDASKETVVSTLEKADVIFVCGGNTFYLLHHARQSGFADLVPKFVERGAIYIGSSAGSYLACPTIEAAGWKNQDKNTVGLTDLTGMNLVPFIIFAHYKSEHDEILEVEKPKTKFEIKILTDDQVLLVQEDKVIQI